MLGKPVVVGVNGTDEALEAVEFAAVEAAARGTYLRIVHAACRPVHWRWRADVTCPRPWHPEVEALMNAAQERAHDKIRGLTVSTVVLAEDPIAALVHQVPDAAVLVVGRRHRPLVRIRSTTVVAHIASHVSCPVIVAQGVSEAAANIVVGIGDAPAGEATLRFAFAEAEARRTGVTAIHAFRAPVLAGRGVDGGVAVVDELEGNAVAARTLSEALAGWSNCYPDIPVRRTVPEGSGADALVQASTWAQMLVIGTEGGPVTAVSHMVHEVVRRSLCPVAVVPA